MKETLHKRNNQKSIDIDYLLYKPNSYEQNPQYSYPLIVFLHGGSIEENEFETLKEKGINQYITDGNELESLVVSPLHYDPDKFWSEQTILAIIEEIVETHRVDANRINLMGISRGGYAVWRLAIQYSNSWASCVVAGGACAPFVYAFKFPKLPIWAFHGRKDEIVPISVTESMVNQLKSLGSPIKFTVVPDGGHDSTCWDEAFLNPSVYDWVLRQVLPK